MGIGRTKSMPRGVYSRTANQFRVAKVNLAKGRLPAARKKASLKLRILGQSEQWRQRVSEATRIAMRRPDVRQKHLRGLMKARKEHGVNFRGGNGMLPTITEATMAIFLRPLGFHRGIIIPTRGHKTGLRSPTHYKPDLANPETMTVIEIDGPSHRVAIQMERDRRKERILGALGWKVIRLPHR